MSPESFEQELRQQLARQPFVPFIVELQEGRQISVDRPAVAINNGGAGFLSDEEGLVDIEAGNVRRIVPPTGEAAKGN